VTNDLAVLVIQMTEEGRMAKAEPAGDPARNAAALVESFLEGSDEDDKMRRAVAVAVAAGEYHDPPTRYCPMMTVAIHLAEGLAELARETETDLAPMLARWRDFADWLESGGDG
jgi:hypothetical protein